MLFLAGVPSLSHPLLESLFQLGGLGSAVSSSSGTTRRFMVRFELKIMPLSTQIQQQPLICVTNKQPLYGNYW